MDKPNILIVLRGGLGGFVQYRINFLNLISSYPEYEYYFYIPSDRKFYFQDKIPKNRLFIYDFIIKPEIKATEIKGKLINNNDLFERKFFLGICAGGEFMNIDGQFGIENITLTEFIVKECCQAYINLGSNTGASFIDKAEKYNKKKRLIICSNLDSKVLQKIKDINECFFKESAIRSIRCHNFDFSSFNISEDLINLIKKWKKNSKIIAINPYTSDILKDYSLAKAFELKNNLATIHNKIILIGETSSLINDDYCLIEADNQSLILKNTSLKAIEIYLRRILPRKYKVLELKYIIFHYRNFSNLCPSRFDVIYNNAINNFTIEVRCEPIKDALGKSINFFYRYVQKKVNLKKRIPEDINNRDENDLKDIIFNTIRNDNINIIKFLNHSQKSNLDNLKQDNFINRLNLHEYIYLINQLDLLISCDSSGLWYAHLGEIPSIGLFLPNHYYKMRYPESNSYPYRDFSRDAASRSIVSPVNNMNSINVDSIYKIAKKFSILNNR